MRLTDWRGNEYGIGDTILYPVSRGSSSAYLNEGTVLEYVPAEGEGYFDKGASLRVRPTRSSRFGTPSRVVTLTNFSSITAVE